MGKPIVGARARAHAHAHRSDLQVEITNQALAHAVDANKVAIMLMEGYSEREIKTHLDLDSSVLATYKQWIIRAIDNTNPPETPTT